jgi:hypothetical protein
VRRSECKTRYRTTSTFSLRHTGHCLCVSVCNGTCACTTVQYPNPIHDPIRTAHSTAALHSQLTYAFFSRSSSETLSCRSRFSVHRSAHLAHERGDASGARAIRQRRETYCEQRFALSNFSSTQKKILVRAKLRQLAYALASFFRSLSLSLAVGTSHGHARHSTGQYTAVTTAHCPEVK